MEIVLNQRLRQIYNNLKLSIELVPSTCWWSNVRSNLTKTQWDKLRKSVYEKENHKCEICGGIGTKHPVECHEVWSYNHENKIQTLKCFISICPLCHQVKHIGLTANLGQEYAERAYERFKVINRLSETDAEILYNYTWQEWKNRSKYEWEMDISLLNNYGLEIEKTKFNQIDRKHFVKNTIYPPHQRF